MRKKVMLIVVLAVLVVLGAVFAVLNIHAPGKLSIWQKKEIEYHWTKTQGHIFRGWNDEGITLGMRYYGSENGYTILLAFPDGSLGIPHKKVIADQAFEFEFGGFMLFAYKNGIFYDLNEAYMQGFVSKATIIEAKILHDKYQETFSW